MPMWQQCPAATRHTIVTYPIVSLILSITGLIQFVILVPAFIFDFPSIIIHVHTIFTSCLARSFSDPFAFIMILLEMFMVMRTLAEEEKKHGSVGFIWWMLSTNALISAVYLPFAFILGLVFRSMWYMPHQGLFTLVIFNITQKSVEFPEMEMNMWGFPMKMKYYPFALVAIICLLSQALVLDQMAAVIVGLVYTKHRLNRVLLKPSMCVKLDKIFSCCRIWKDGGEWLPPPSDDQTFFQTMYNNVQDLAGQARQHLNENKGSAPATNKEDVFTGTGQRLGDGPQTPSTMDASHRFGSYPTYSDQSTYQSTYEDVDLVETVTTHIREVTTTVTNAFAPEDQPLRHDVRHYREEV